MNRAARIMTAGTHAAYLSADELLTHARQHADATIAKSQAGYDEACERGYQAGQAEARQQALQDQVKNNLDRQNTLKNLQADLNALVLQTIHQLLGEIDCATRIDMLIREGLMRLGKQQGEISIHVHPELREQITSRMAHWELAHPGSSIKTIANPEIGMAACRILSSSGRVDGDLQLQLEAFESALESTLDSTLEAAPPC